MTERKKVLTDPITERFNKATMKRLREHGKGGQTLDEILNVVLDKIEKGE